MSNVKTKTAFPRPCRDYLILRQHLAEETSEGGIVLPDSSKQQKLIGIIVAVGPKVEGLTDGDEVLFSSLGAVRMDFENEELLILLESDILVVF